MLAYDIYNLHGSRTLSPGGLWAELWKREKGLHPLETREMGES
jgi:hypothetical protein